MVLKVEEYKKLVLQLKKQNRMTVIVKGDKLNFFQDQIATIVKEVQNGFFFPGNKKKGRPKTKVEKKDEIPPPPKKNSFQFGLYTQGWAVRLLVFSKSTLADRRPCTIMIDNTKRVFETTPQTLFYKLHRRVAQKNQSLWSTSSEQV